MGNRVSRVVGCFVPASHDRSVFFTGPTPDEGLGHSFCYVRPSLESLHLSPSHSDRCNASGLDSSELHTSSFRSSIETLAFKAISGASVSANTSTPHTILSHEQLHSFTNVPDDCHAAFESSASFASLPLQPVPRGVTFSGPISSTYSGPISAHVPYHSFMFGGEQQQRGIERGFMSGPIERGYMSGPIDTIHTDNSHFSAPLTGPYHHTRKRNISRSLLSSVGKPVKGALTKAISSSLAHTHRSIAVLVRQLVSRRLRNGSKEMAVLYDSSSQLRDVSSDAYPHENCNLQWAQGKAGEDRVHVVVSEEHGWLFVGIYDGFNGPDAPDFLMRNLYRAFYKELQGLLWDAKDGSDGSKGLDEYEANGGDTIQSSESSEMSKQSQVGIKMEVRKDMPDGIKCADPSQDPQTCSPAKVEKGGLTRSRTLKELLEIGDTDDDACINDANTVIRKEGRLVMDKPGLSCSHSNGGRNMTGCQLAPNSVMTNEGHLLMEKPGLTYSRSNCERSMTGCQLDTGLQKRASDCMCSFQEVGSGDNLACFTINEHAKQSKPLGWSGKILSMPSLRHKQSKSKESHRKLLPRRYNGSVELNVQDMAHGPPKGDAKPWREEGAVDHDAVLAAMARALESTEEAYLDMADSALEQNPELGLIGSCILIALMKDKDVYILNVGDSRAIVAQQKRKESGMSLTSNEDSLGVNGERERAACRDLERIAEEGSMSSAPPLANGGPPASSASLNALQLSVDHSTCIEEEVLRIKSEHPDDNMCIINDRVKGRLKVTRAFGAGFLKKPRWNNAVLKMFQIDYVGSAPYISCLPALHHHRLGPEDRFLILSSDGLYQYFSNDEVVSHVEWFMEKFPEGDPAQHLIEELLFRAAKKAGMDFHDLLDIPHGDRRKYHDDVSVMVVSLDGRMWRSSG